MSPARRTVLPALAPALTIGLLGTLAGCPSLPDFSKLDAPAAAKEAEPTGRIEARREVDEASGRPTHEWTVLVAPGRGAIKHGQERSWYANGALHWEREFRYGKPTGVWRSWYESGTPRTECYYFGPEVERTMTFWREDGKLTAQGPACDGARKGVWKFWWSNGQLAERGEYRGGVREGVWSAWSEDGERHYEHVYEKNVRVSQRELDPTAETAAPASAPQLGLDRPR